MSNRNLIQIKPRRFVYHITNRSCRNSINQNGILTSSNLNLKFENAVFANNSKPNLDWYPFRYDIYENEFNMERYDIWRIDNRKVKTEWYIDERITNENADEYIHTFKPIPREAITLFKPIPKFAINANGGSKINKNVYWEVYKFRMKQILKIN